MSAHNKWNGRPFLAVLFLTFSPVLFATSSLQSVFEGLYSDSETTDSADCQACHAVRTFQLNAYGKALCDQLTDEVTSTDRILSFITRARAVESIDSDGDGYTNLEEINNDVQPGWTTGALNPTYQTTVGSNDCVATGAFEEAPTWVQAGGLDPSSGDNLAPIARNDLDSTTAATPVTIDVLANDNDPDGDSIEVLNISTSASTHGFVDNDGDDVTYTPDVGFCGSASFQYQITDGEATSNYANVTISVGDGTAPVVTPPSANLELSIPAGTSSISASDPAIQAWLDSATAFDALDGTVSVINTAPTSFPAGSTIVVFSAMDSCGNSGTATANVIISVDANNDPVVDAPTPNTLDLTAPLCAVSLPATDPSISSWLNAASANDIEDGALSVSNNAPANFSIGGTIVQFSATDSLGATSTDTGIVNVIETPNSVPVVTAPSPLSLTVSATTTSVSASDADIQNFLLSASASDAEDGALLVIDDAPSEFPLGTTTVTFQTIDDCGVTSSSQSTVTIVADLTNNPPSITAPAPTSLETALCVTSLPKSDALVASFFNGASASDIEDGDLTAFIVDDAPENLPVSSLPGILTTVTFSVTDSGFPADSLLSATTTSLLRLTDPNTLPIIVAPDPITTTIPNATIPASDPIITSFLGSASATDAEDGVLAYTNNAPAVFVPGTTTVTFTTLDSCGLEVSRTSTVTIPIDDTAPVISLEGDNPFNIGQYESFVDPGATAFDDFDGDVSGDIIVSGSVDTSVIGTYALNYNVVDASGNAATTVTRIVNVTDSTPPVITMLGSSPLEIELGSTYVDAGATASDDVDGDITGLIVVSNTVNTDAIGTYTITYDVTDAAGNSAETVIRTVFVIPPDTTAPVITLLGDNPFELEQNIFFNDPGATAADDSDGDISADIVVTGTVDYLTVGTYTLTYNVSDSAGNAAATVTRTVNVVPRPDDVAPVINLIGNNPFEVIQNESFVDPGASAFDDIDGEISSDIAVSGTVDTLNIGTYEVFYNVSDAAGNAAVTVTRVVNVIPPPDTTAPEITLVGSDPIDVELGQTFTDPGAIAIDDQDGDISASIVTSGSVDTAVLGTYILSYDVSDAAGNAATTVTRTVNVVEPPDTTAPIITLLGANPVEVEQNEVFVDPGAVANDDVDGNISADIVVSGAVDTTTLGTYTLNYDVVDAAGNAAATLSRTVIVIPPIDDTPPVITLIGGNPLEIEQNAVFVDPGASATDDFDGDLSASIVSSGTVNTSVVGTYTLSYTVADAAGNSATVTRTVNVVIPVDSTPPVISLLGANPLVIEQNSPFTDPGATAFDETDGDVTASILATGTVNTSILGTYNRVYTVNDAAGNTSSVTRIVNVVVPSDTIPPVISLIGANPFAVEQGTPFVDPGATASDNIDGDISAEILISGTVDTSTIGSYTRIYTVIDSAGNVATATRTVSVTSPADTIAPVISLLGANPLTIEQGSTFTDPGAIASDNVDGDISGSIVASGSVNTAVIGTYTRTYNVSDSAGNAAVTVSRVVNVTAPADTVAPVITLLGANPINVEQDGTFVDPGATASDNVDGDISASIVASGLVNTAVIGTYVRSYNVTDAAGNAAVTVSRVVNVTAPIDTTAPVITLVGANPINIEQGTTFTDPGATASDNVDGDISASITATGTVNTSVAGTYVLTYNVTDAAGNAATSVTRNVSVQPSEAPVVTLFGNNPVEIYVGATYNEPGFAAADNVDGDLTGSVVVNDSAVNTAVVGSYTVSYSVTDSAGNTSDPVSRTVNVISATNTYTANPGLSVGAASVSTTLFVPDDRIISDLNVFIDMAHDYPGDISLILTSPAGTSVTIVDDPGKPASTWGCSRDDFLVTIDDEGSSPIEDACASSVPAITGTLTPNNPLSAFDGESSQGTWTLQINDSYTSADGGTLNSWSLIIEADTSSAPDLVAPVISLIGDNPIVVPVGGSYSEPGYTATDNIDGNVTGAVTVNSSAVNTAIAGSYRVTYSVTDSSGNSASVIRWVNVTAGPDTTAPVITLVGSNPLDVTQGSAYVDPGFTATDNADGDVSSSVIVDSSAVNTSVLGTYTVTYNVSDAAGNAATTVSRTVNVVEVTDITAPVISLLGANPIEVLQGGSYSEPGFSATDDFDGDITGNVAVNASGVNTSVIGTYSVVYSVSDAAGNSAAISRTVNVVSATSTYPANPGLPVGAASVSTTLFVSDDREIADLNVFIDMSHAYVGDISIILTSPFGTSVTIVDRPGQPASTWGCSRDDFLVTLDDEASSPVESACATSPAVGGTLTPNNPLSAFDGESSRGTWTLRVDDAYTSADNGTLNSWNLVITAAEIATPDPTADTVPPVISLVGSSTIDHPNGAAFTDPGATASDNVDGNITSNISVSGSVNVNVNGTYILTYSVQDAAGNDAATVTRTVNVVAVDPISIQAETGTIGGSHNIAINHIGFTGSGFVDYVGEGYMEYTFEASAVPYELTVRYALASGNRPLEVILNGVSVGTISFPGTGTWFTWRNTSALVINPLSGTNTLRLQTTGSSGTNVDSLNLNPQ